MTLPVRNESVWFWREWVVAKSSGDIDPIRINNTFTCSGEGLRSLIGAPKICNGYFDCNDNELTSLKGAPILIDGDFYCENNNLTSLKFFPREISGGADCHKNNITTLKDIHKRVKYIHRHLDLTENPIVSNILGLLLIEELQDVKGDSPAFIIVNNHLQGDRDVLECQENLIIMGYKEFAKF